MIPFPYPTRDDKVCYIIKKHISDPIYGVFESKEELKHGFFNKLSKSHLFIDINEFWSLSIDDFLKSNPRSGISYEIHPIRH